MYNINVQLNIKNLARNYKLLYAQNWVIKTDSLKKKSLFTDA